jgi:hypothetical protein
MRFWHTYIIPPFSPLYCCAGWGTLWHFQSLLQCIKYIILEFTPSTALLYPHSPNSWKFQQVSFLHLHTYVYIFLCSIHPPIPFPYHLHPPTGANHPSSPPPQDLFHLPVLWFCRRKKIKRKTQHFC